jgi:prepilin-type N-terminal cleavage/methylation domain-containing protein/prepilin-type processing-associated H-X9-DG protein
MRKKAFTLIELLVVIAIIAVLISILLPSLVKARQSARGVKCATGLKRIGMTFQYYANDYNNFIPPGWGDPATVSDNDVYARESTWIYQLGKYLNYNHTEAFYNPASDSNRFNPFTCPEVGIAICYAMPRGLSTVWFPSWNTHYRKMDSLESPATTVAMLDFYPAIFMVDWWIPPTYSIWSNVETRRLLRHGSTDNFLFIDGHVEALTQNRELLAPYVAMY